MINLDFYLAIGAYSALFLGVILFFWLSTKKKQAKELTLKEEFIWFCSVCTYTYVNTKDEKITVCPRCGNYNKK